PLGGAVEEGGALAVPVQLLLDGAVVLPAGQLEAAVADALPDAVVLGGVGDDIVAAVAVVAGEDAGDGAAAGGPAGPLLGLGLLRRFFAVAAACGLALSNPVVFGSAGRHLASHTYLY